jgi:hypothetical protein
VAMSGTVGGDVGDWSWRTGRSTRGGDVATNGAKCRGLVGDHRWRCRGPRRRRRGGSVEDWSVHPWVGDAGGLVGDVVGAVGDRSVAMSGTGRRRRRGLVGDWPVHPCGDAGGLSAAMSVVSRLVGGDVGDWSAARRGLSEGLSVNPRVATLADWSWRRCRGTGRGPVGRCRGTGRRRRRGLVGGLVGPPVGGGRWRTVGGDVRGPRRTGRWRCRGPVGATSGGRLWTGRSTVGTRGPVAAMSGGLVEDWSVAMSDWWRRRRGLVGDWSVHPWWRRWRLVGAMSGP